MAPKYAIRPGKYSDLKQGGIIYERTIGESSLFDIIFPSRHANPESFSRWVSRLFWKRYWAIGSSLICLVNVDEEGQGSAENDSEQVSRTPERLNEAEKLVGFAWWERPVASMSFYECWISPDTWLRYWVSTANNYIYWLFPIKGIDYHVLGAGNRVLGPITDSLLNTPRRKRAWYLPTLCVDPEYQGKGLGKMLLLDGLNRADRAGEATYLTALGGLENFYTSYGFVEAGRGNVGELCNWDGGSIMFRE